MYIVTQRTGAFVIGSILIAAGLWDAVSNPFAFITADKLVGSGLALIGISVGSKSKESIKEVD